MRSPWSLPFVLLLYSCAQLCVLTDFVEAQQLLRPWSKASAPASRLVIGEESFINAGQNLRFYQIYSFTGQGNTTSVKRLTITPAHDACSASTVEASQGVLPETITQLLSNENPCSIPEKVLRREANRCGDCAISGGAHITMEVACHKSDHLIRFEVLDKDIFEPLPDTPKHTSKVFQLLKQVNAALGNNVMDRPAFPAGGQKPEPLPPPSSELNDLANGNFDLLFEGAPDKPSILYKQTHEPRSLPTVTLKQSIPIAPLQAKLPDYPPSARTAHLDGDVEIRLVIGPDGDVKSVSALSGPSILQRGTLETANQWQFPKQPQSTNVNATISYRMNCSAVTQR